MTRAECEEKIRNCMNMIDAVYHQYNPEGKYLTLSIQEDVILFNNDYWETDKKIDYRVELGK